MRRLAFESTWEPKTSVIGGKAALCQISRRKMAFTSDCFYAVKPTHTVARPQAMVLDKKEGIIVCTQMFVPPEVIK